MPRRNSLLLGLAASAALLAGAAHAQSAAPQPAKRVDPERLYTGAWHELARNPMPLVKGCVAGLTEFSRDTQGRLFDRDSCRQDGLDGKERVIAGPAELDPADPAKFTTHYKVVGPFGPSRTYWVLDRDEDYRWFIDATPDFKNLSIFIRDPADAARLRDRLTARARELGFTGELEYPELPGGR